MEGDVHMTRKLFISFAVVFGLVLGLAALAADAQPSKAPPPQKPAILHIQSATAVFSKCGKALEFKIEVVNSGGAYNGSAWVYIKSSDNQIGHEFKTIAAGATYHDVQASDAISADCCKPQCYKIILSGPNGSGDVPEWDKKAFEVCTTPVCRLEVTAHPFR
jgi:hypothetical protein